MPDAAKRPCTICRRWFRPDPFGVVTSIQLAGGTRNMGTDEKKLVDQLNG